MMDINDLRLDQRYGSITSANAKSADHTETPEQTYIYHFHTSLAVFFILQP